MRTAKMSVDGREYLLCFSGRNGLYRSHYRFFFFGQVKLHTFFFVFQSGQF